MPDFSKTLVKLAAALVKHQVKDKLGDEFVATAAKELAEFAGETVNEKIAIFLDQGQQAEQILDAFKDADRCFVQNSENEVLSQAIISMPFAALPSLEKLAIIWSVKFLRQKMKTGLLRADILL